MSARGNGRRLRRKDPGPRRMVPLNPAPAELPPVDLAAAAVLAAWSSGNVGAAVDAAYAPAFSKIADAGATETVQMVTGRPAALVSAMAEAGERLIATIGPEYLRLLVASTLFGSVVLDLLVQETGKDAAEIIRDVVDGYAKIGAKNVG